MLWLLPGASFTPLAASVLSFFGGSLLPMVGLAWAAPVVLPKPATLLCAGAACLALLVVALLGASTTTTLLTTDAALVTLAWALGGTLGRHVQHAAHLLPACAVAAAADLASLLSPEGPSHAIARSDRALSVLATWFPVPGSGAVSPALGIGDLLFIGLVLGVAEVHALPRGRCVGACALGTLLAGGAALWLNVAIPALVPIAAAVVLLVPQVRRVRRADRTATRFSMSVAGAAALVVIVRHVFLR